MLRGICPSLLSSWYQEVSPRSLASILSKDFQLADSKIEGLTVIGSLVGTEDELVELMEMAGKGEIRSVLEIYEHKELGEVLKKLSKGDITGRAVIRIR